MFFIVLFMLLAYVMFCVSNKLFHVSM